MDSVIPPEVIEQIRAIQEERSSTEGLFTARDVAGAMDVPLEDAKDHIRGWLRAGRVRPRRIGLTDQQAWAMGYLGGGSVLGYVWVEGDAA